MPIRPDTPQTAPGAPTTLVQARWLLNQRKFSIFPLDSPLEPIATSPEQVGKVPAIKWTKYKESPPSEADLNAWFGNGHNRNIAIVTGRVSGIVIIDIDSPEAHAWASENLPATPMQTRSGTGAHWYYRHPGQPVPNKAKIRTGAGRIALDCRGDGGYVVAPGSLHASGTRYERVGDWSLPLDRLPIFEPAWLAPVTPPVQSTSTRRLTAPRVDDRLRRAAAYLSATPPAIQGQAGDEHTYQVCCRVALGFDLDDADALDLLRDWNQRNVPPWTEAELAAKLAGARKYGTPADSSAPMAETTQTAIDRDLEREALVALWGHIFLAEIQSGIGIPMVDSRRGTDRNGEFGQ